MRAAIYSCVSIKDDPQIADIQIQQMKDQARREKIEIVQVYRDVIQHLGSNRTAYQSMLLSAKHHHFDALLFWSLEQLSRENANSTLQLLDKLSNWGIRFFSNTERHLDSLHPSHEIVTAILSTLLKQNRVYIGEKTRIGIEKQIKAQKPGPKGKIGPGRPTVIFDTKQAQDLRLQGKPYAAIAEACGVSKATICRFFQAQKTKRKRGKS